jgi:tetratricopeptide (TPR) repeat protein
VEGVFGSPEISACVKPMSRKQQKKKQTQSGAVGGPGTGAGLNFQVDFAVLQCLEKISQALVNPLDQSEISMEPRLVSGKSVTCWDVRTIPPDTATEAKLRPKRDEILEWLDRVESGAKQSGGRHFQLFYGRGAGPLLSAVERLCRIAREAGGDRDKFNGLVQLERTADVEVVLDRLKTEPHSSLLRVHVVPIDPAALERDIQFDLRHLVREPDRRRLYDLLNAKFHRGIEHRVTYKVCDLIGEAEKDGIAFFPPATFQLSDLDSLVSGAVFVLQNCELGLPADVLAGGLGCTAESVNRSLAQYTANRVVTEENGLWAIPRPRTRLFQPNGSQLLGRTLLQLFEFIRSNKQTPEGWMQVPNAIALAKVCQTDHPELASCLFWKLDKLLKRRGNKRLVLEVANLSIAAAHSGPRTETQARAEAVALVCGRSWVYQRINRLPEARAEGEKSLQLGREIGWDRNTAYCLKCLGRLLRMEAAGIREDKAKREQLIAASIEHLRQAIDLFPRVSELSEADRTSEVGDCFSLLGRTYLSAGDRAKANEAARQAIARITDQTSKDYADLQILLGDLASAGNDKAAAESYYDTAVRVAGTSDAERSEIAARAWFQKGKVMRQQACFQKAAEIWERLEEDENSDRAKWESMVIGGDVPSSAIAILEEESPSVRVEMLRLHQARLELLSGPSRGRRSEPDKNYWRSLIPDARRNVAVRHIDW